MLTIDEIKNISFRKATLSGGYRAEDVDAFIDEVIATFEQQKKEKTNLVHKIDRLATRLEEYREDEETVRNALLTSQKMSDACIKEAKEKAAKIIRDAEEKAQNLVAESNNMTVNEKERYLRLQADAAELRNELIELYSRHIKNIDDLPTASEVEETRRALDEKYPTEPLIGTAPAAPAPAPAVPVPHVPAPQPEPAPAPTPAAPAPAEEIAEPKHAAVEEPTPTPAEEAAPAALAAPAPAAGRVPLKRPAKFSHLKFGENYDVSDDDE